MGGRAIPSTIRSRITRLILLHVRPAILALECNCAVSTVYQIQESLFVYGSHFRASFRKQGKPRFITAAAGEANRLHSGAAMGYAERDGFIFVGGVGPGRTSIYCWPISEANTVKCNMRSPNRRPPKHRALFGLDSQPVEYHEK